MKTNIITALCAMFMVVFTVGALFFAMTVYEQDNFEESWTMTPAVIEDGELKPLYSEEFDADSTEY